MNKTTDHKETLMTDNKCDTCTNYFPTCDTCTNYFPTCNPAAISFSSETDAVLSCSGYSPDLRGTAPDVMISDDLASPITAVDIVELVRGYLLEEFRGCAIGSLTHKVAKAINSYDKCVTDNAIDVDNLTQEKASDKELQKVAHDYGMTMNQVVAFMDMCEQVNSNMGGTGVIAVPFWFHAQYVNLQNQNQALIQQTDNLMATLSVVEKKIASGQSTIEDLGLQMPQRKNIITGVTTPYIAGVTGARLGDEHLDAEHIYVPPHSGRR